MGGAGMSRHGLVVAGILLAMGWAGQLAVANVSEEQAAKIAIAAARRAGAETCKVTAYDRSERSHRFTIDQRWWVTIGRTAGQPTMIVDRGFLKSPHAEHRLGARPTSAQIEAAGRELVAKVIPDLNMAEMELAFTMVQPKSAYVEACWHQVIAENGFEGPAKCGVKFCWPDRALESVRSEDPSTPREWRRPATVTAEQAEEIARPTLGDLNGGWIETTKDFCAEPQATRRGPAWNVLVRVGPRDRPQDCAYDRSVFVDPWSGEVMGTAEWLGAAALRQPVREPTQPGPPGSRVPAGAASRPWLPWAGGAAVLLVLGAATVCLRRRRS